MPKTRPAITSPQKRSIISIITSPPAPHIHHIGCICQLHSHTRSWSNGDPVPRAPTVSSPRSIMTPSQTLARLSRRLHRLAVLDHHVADGLQHLPAHLEHLRHRLGIRLSHHPHHGHHAAAHHARGHVPAHHAAGHHAHHRTHPHAAHHGRLPHAAHRPAHPGATRRGRRHGLTAGPAGLLREHRCHDDRDSAHDREEPHQSVHRPSFSCIGTVSSILPLAPGGREACPRTPATRSS